MTQHKLTLNVLKGDYAIIQLAPSDPLPLWATQGSFFCITKTQEELSLVVDQDRIPQGLKAEKDWKLLKIVGPFAFDQVGILNTVTEIFALHKIGIFALSTFDTDYILVKVQDLIRAVEALRIHGQTVVNP